MSIIHIDGFDWVPSTSVLATLKGYLAAAGWYISIRPNADCEIDKAWPSSTTTGRFGFGTALQWNTGIVSLGGPVFMGIVKPISWTGTFAIISCSAKRASTALVLGAPSGACVGFYNSVTQTCSLAITLSPTGIVTAWTANSSTGVMTVKALSSPGVCKDDAWSSLQAKAKTGLTSGEIEVRVNNKTVISIIDTRVDAFDCVCMGVVQGTGLSQYRMDTSFDDLAVIDSSGTIHNTFLGNLRVKSQVVIADGTPVGTTIGGTSPAATHWQSVDTLRVDDSKYVYSAVNSTYDLYGLDPNQSAPYARAIQVRVVARQDDATQRTIKNKLKTPSTLLTSSTLSYLDQTYTHWNAIWETNPDTGVDFTGTEVNALKAGFEIIS